MSHGSLAGNLILVSNICFVLSNILCLSSSMKLGPGIGCTDPAISLDTTSMYYSTHPYNDVLYVNVYIEFDCKINARLETSSFVLFFSKPTLI